MAETTSSDGVNNFVKDARLTYTVDETAHLLGVGRATLYQHIARGDVPNAGFGRVKRIPAWWVRQRIAPQPCS